MSYSTFMTIDAQEQHIAKNARNDPSAHLQASQHTKQLSQMPTQRPITFSTLFSPHFWRNCQKMVQSFWTFQKVLHQFVENAQETYKSMP